MDIEQAAAKVEQLDFTMLKRKLEHADGWSASAVAEAESLYRKYLCLGLVYRNRTLGPSRMIDEFWHAHILDTRAYTADCEMLFGAYQHHYPYGGAYGDPLDRALSAGAYDETCRLFRKHFDIDLKASVTRGE